MKIVIIALLSIIIGLFLYFNVKGKLDKKKSIILGILSVFCIIIIFIYTNILDRKNHTVADIIAAFQRGESVKCGEIEISSETFTFTNGTLSFTGKINTKYHNKIIAIEDCKIE